MQARSVDDAEHTMPTFGQFVADHYMPHAMATKRSACWEQIIFRNHLLPAFGHLRMDEITRAAINVMIQQKVSQGYRPGTVNRILANLKTVFARAVEWEIGGLEKNIARQVKPLRDPPHLDRFLTPVEAERLIKQLHKSQSPMLRYIIPFLLFTGARKREALDARWMNVDFDRRLWTIPLSKSGKPRFVPLSDQAIRVLRNAKTAANIMGMDDSQWIFPNPMTGKPYTSIFQPWDICRRAAGLADVRIHDLRHSFASALVNRGMTLFDVKEALGHSNIATTQRYAHLSPERLRNAVTQAGEYYGAPMTNQNGR
jgi:integrase